MGPQKTIDAEEIVVIGLGHVGLPLAAALAGAGHRVLGIDVDRDHLADIHAGSIRIHEPGLTDLIAEGLASGRLRTAAAIPASLCVRIYIVTVGTPVHEDKSCSLDALRDAVREIARRMRPDDLVILRSTVKPGVARSLVVPMLERTGKTFGFAVCPERIVEGQALRELHTIPQIIGAADPASALRAETLFASLGVDIVHVPDVESAEMVKLINNMARDLNFALTNEIAAICDTLALDASAVIHAAVHGYKRTDLPSVGLVGGPCLSKDTYIFQSAFAGTGFEPQLTWVARQINEAMPKRGAAAIAGLLTPRFHSAGMVRVALLGLAFKGRPATADVRGTMAVPFMSALQSRLPGAVFIGFDAEVRDGDIRALGVEPASSIEQAVDGAALTVILNNHERFDRLDLDALAGRMVAGGVIYDFWPCTDRAGPLAGAVDYVAYGEGSQLQNTVFARTDDGGQSQIGN
ncbi:nucleotide sugar dehydrogenase [Eilatimonas milleporae]|uniref:UDP-N-acetyl-D-mannosaminuronic acid dehydrogenase n=1 Tax=Eilatimonas milleporae TaxID=911205 RepID=A0A3M0C4J4_9PROT|nr:nucleotide sugar dehydrogenase [Eilatimonas milleporae]RMB04771.1 UDP-N-acetyl-D-mannosaminuronic acid dehydrogenase [Eilatimonas milleporae]